MQSPSLSTTREQGSILSPNLSSGRSQISHRPLGAFDLKLLADLPSLMLKARYVMDGAISGAHRSPQKGSSVEFSEYRDYQLGDDLRRVDWRLYGRTDRLHVKQYEEETQLRVFILLDTSGSMDYRSRDGVLRKMEYARIVACALALVAHRQGDAFGLGIAGTELQDFLRARASMGHWRTFVGKAEHLPIGGPTSLGACIEQLAEVIPARSVVVVISDFYEDEEATRVALRRLRYDHHDILGVQIADPQEVDFDLDHSGTFVDLESGLNLRLDASSVRRGYLERYQQFRRGLEELFQENGGELGFLRTDEPPVRALAQYLAMRENRL